MGSFNKIRFSLALAAAVILLSGVSLAQDSLSPPGPSAQPEQSNRLLTVLKDPENVTFLAFIGANIADAKTDWHFVGPITHREYNITPAQRLSIALGSAAVALYLREQFPRMRKPVTIGMGILTAYFAGRALANTYNHGGVASPVVPTVQARASPGLAFAVKLR